MEPEGRVDARIISINMFICTTPAPKTAGNINLNKLLTRLVTLGRRNFGILPF